MNSNGRAIYIFIIFIIQLTSCNKRQQVQSRPNIIFIMSDDHANKAISAYDNTLIHTPNIDRLAQEGMLFTNANVTNSLCAPSRAVMLTGKYSNENGLRNNSDTFNGDQISWVKLLQKQGYYTSIIGKWHLKTRPQGFDYWDVLVGQGNYYNPEFIENGDTNRVHGYVTNLIMNKALQKLKSRDSSRPFAMLIHNKAPHRTWMPDSTHMNLFNNKKFPLPETFFDDYSTRSAATKAQKMKVRNMLLSQDMKLPLKYFNGNKTSVDGNENPTSSYRERIIETGSGGFRPGHDAIGVWQRRYNRMTSKQKKIWDAHYDSIGQAYLKSKPKGKSLAFWKYQRFIKDYLRVIASVDDNVGRLLDYLDKVGLTKNTIVVYTSDQGFYLGEHGWFDKRFMYEPSLNTPLLIRYPKEIKAGQRSDEMVLNVDFAPTFVDEAGLKIPKEMQGRSLRPIFKGEADNWRNKMYYHYYESGYPHNVSRHFGIKTDQYKLIHFYDPISAWELYDYKNDPHEVNNLYSIPAYQSLTDSLKRKLQQLQLKYKDTNFDSSLVN